MKLYLKYFTMQLKAELEYRKAFLISIIAKMATSIFSFISIFFLFDKFGSIAGYTFEDVLICFAISFMGYSLSFVFQQAILQDFLSGGYSVIPTGISPQWKWSGLWAWWRAELSWAPGEDLRAGEKLYQSDFWLLVPLQSEWASHRILFSTLAWWYFTELHCKIF